MKKLESYLYFDTLFFRASMFLVRTSMYLCMLSYLALEELMVALSMIHLYQQATDCTVYWS